MNDINISLFVFLLAIISTVFCGGPSSPCNGTKLYDSNLNYLKSICIYNTFISISDAQNVCKSLGAKLIEAHDSETLKALGVYAPQITYEDGRSYWTTSIDDKCYEIVNEDPWIAYQSNCDLKSYYMCEFVDPSA